jgi:hypothetical protein
MGGVPVHRYDPKQFRPGWAVHGILLQFYFSKHYVGKRREGEQK